jgi:hypothetical protein
MPETRGDINLAVVGAGMGTDRRSVADTMRILHGRGRNFADVVDTIYRQIYLLAVTKHTYKSMNRPLPIRTSRSLGRLPLGRGNNSGAPGPLLGVALRAVIREKTERSTNRTTSRCNWNSAGLC